MMNTTRTAEVIWDRDHGPENNGYYVRLHGEDIEDVALDAVSPADARRTVELLYPGVTITRVDDGPDYSAAEEEWPGEWADEEEDR